MTPPGSGWKWQNLVLERVKSGLHNFFFFTIICISNRLGRFLKSNLLHLLDQIQEMTGRHWEGQSEKQAQISTLFSGVKSDASIMTYSGMLLLPLQFLLPPSTCTWSRQSPLGRSSFNLVPVSTMANSSCPDGSSPRGLLSGPKWTFPRRANNLVSMQWKICFLLVGFGGGSC